MSFYEYHLVGGILHMTLLSIIALLILGLSIKKTIDLFISDGLKPYQLERGLSGIIFLGSFAFFWGIFGQAIAIYEAMSAIEKMGSVSPAMLAGGLKVSLIVPIYGLMIFLVSSIFWYLLRMRCGFLLKNQIPH